MHKTITIDAWTIDQHPNPDACISTMREWDHVYNWHGENRQSLEAFCQLLEPLLTVRDWAYGCGEAWISFSLKPMLCDAQETMPPVRIWKWLHNNGIVAAIQKDCPFTGYIADEYILGPLRRFIEQPDSAQSISELLSNCLHAWVYFCRDDMEYAYSDKGLTELATDNDYFFNADGQII